MKYYKIELEDFNVEVDGDIGLIWGFFVDVFIKTVSKTKAVCDNQQQISENAHCLCSYCRLYSGN